MQSAIEDELESLRTEQVHFADQPGGTITRRVDSVEEYVDHLVSLFGEGTLAGMRIAIDTANGAMSIVAPAVLDRLGADVVVLNDAPTGLNINDGCGATAPQSLCEFVAEAHDGLDVDIAFAFDGDGDRVIAVDENGQEIQALAGHKLKIADVKALYPESKESLTPAPDLTKLGYGKYGMLAEEGLSPDLVASMFGFDSGDQLVRSLLEAKPIKEEIDERTDARMLEEYADLMLNQPVGHLLIGIASMLVVVGLLSVRRMSSFDRLGEGGVR